MASLTTSFDTDFTPAAGIFRVQVNGLGELVSKNSSGVAAFAPVAGNPISGVVEVDNNIAGAVYRVISRSSGATLAVDQ